MKKRLVCLILAGTLLLPSCITRREKPPYTDPEISFDLSIFPLLPALSGIFSDNGLALKTAEDGSYTLSGIGKNTEKRIVVPSSHEGKPITAIDNNAFLGGRHIEEIILPDTLTEISHRFFKDCPNLKYNEYLNLKYLGTENNPYEYLIGVVKKGENSYRIHQNTRVIADEAFYNERLLRSVFFGDSIEYIGNNAFCGCTSLSTFTLPESLLEIEDCAFQTCAISGEMTLPDNLRRIGSEAFSLCKSLSSLILPDSLKEIGDYAFSFCTSLSRVDFSSGLRSIGSGAFESTKLTSVELPEGITDIGSLAFLTARSCKMCPSPRASRSSMQIHSRTAE